MHFEIVERSAYSSEALARRMLAAATGIAPDALRIRRTAAGKPYAENAALHFSISHSDALLLCAVSEQQIGADIQKITLRPAVVRRVCTAEEQDYIQDSPLRFTEVWTRKEAYAKLTGKGLSVGLKSIPTADADHLLPRICGCAVKTERYGEYVYSVVWKD